MSQKFENESFSINLEEKPGCVVTASVIVSPKLLEDLRKKTIKDIKKSITLPGFRKGKAPDSVVISKYASSLDKGLREAVIRAAYQSLCNLAKKPPLSEHAFRYIRIESLNEQGAEVAVSYESFPVVPNVDLDRLSLAEAFPEEPSVSEEDMRLGLENVAYFFATKTPVTRNSQEGDFISLSLHVSEGSDGQEDSLVPVFENKYFKLSQDEMSDVFRDKFLNVATGAKIVEKIESEDIKSFLRGDTLIFTVNSIIEVEVPELDDEKARQVHAESLEDLKEKLRIQLTNKAKNDLHAKKLAAAEKALADAVTFELPETLYKSRLDAIVREKLLNARLIQYCSDAELEERKEEIQKEAEEEATRIVKMSFLIHGVFQQEKLQIAREELQMALELCSRERFGINPPKDAITNDVLKELVATARERLTYQKVMEHVLKKCCSLPSPAAT
ncbi:trigger factor [Chlamydiifrater phoenicopteri]|uniref:trigger factor n=1 Tax=Chlamydiifrater phoenicopteri TaxID=2681469 RepID=UPI001BCE234A|nr:trigger factor [Chlamydiifrater phoenicopteri]